MAVSKERLDSKASIRFLEEIQEELKKIAVLGDKIELLSRLVANLNESGGKDHKLERREKFVARLPELKKKWAEAKRRQIMEIEKNRQSPENLLNKREELYQKYLEADRTSQKELALKFKIQYETLDWAMGRTEKLN